MTATQRSSVSSALLLTLLLTSGSLATTALAAPEPSADPAAASASPDAAADSADANQTAATQPRVEASLPEYSLAPGEDSAAASASPETAADSADASQTAAAQPRVEVSLSEDSLAPGESSELRITVLVPTWMPTPVEFPTLDQPGLRVTLGERSTTPVSQQVDGKTWSGVSRRYQLTPLSAGRFELGGGTLDVSVATPGSPQAKVQQMVLPPISLTASLPEAARGLEPYLAATRIDLEQSLEITRADGDSETLDEIDPDTPLELAPGDSIRRTVSATLEGGSALLLPTLLEAPDSNDSASFANLGVYPQAPRLEESRGGGRRTDTLTYVAEAGGQTELPGVTLRWYNPIEQELDSTSLESVPVSVSGSAAIGSQLKNRAPLLVGLSLLAAVLLGLAVWLYRRLGPRGRLLLEQRRRRQQAHKEANGHADRERLKQAIAGRDLVACRRHWQALGSKLPVDSRAHQQVNDALDRLCRRKLGPDTTASSDLDPGVAEDWQRLEQALPPVRELARHTQGASPFSPASMKPLNPMAEVTRRNA
ncbi:BatD family protein [Halomonas denitrificans]|uniref:BatD family protein n=1 Tax=Halomonas denitrificans TaxID=370769 RepID=UPI001CD747F2|nr:BatD family protein [Halomonas denitrificans]MCA0975271.1 BatD family protein [Halomonas denitrificans]